MKPYDEHTLRHMKPLAVHSGDPATANSKTRCCPINSVQPLNKYVHAHDNATPNSDINLRHQTLYNISLGVVTA